MRAPAKYKPALTNIAVLVTFHRASQLAIVTNFFADAKILQCALLLRGTYWLEIQNLRLDGV